MTNKEDALKEIKQVCNTNNNVSMKDKIEILEVTKKSNKEATLVITFEDKDDNSGLFFQSRTHSSYYI